MVNFLSYVSLGDVKITEVDDMQSDAGRANEVEQCNCGVGYSGLSCEVCVQYCTTSIFINVWHSCTSKIEKLLGHLDCTRHCSHVKFVKGLKSHFAMNITKGNHPRDS